jgi:ubiquinone/menaquinone biosynthesis C-methylase UbiE
VGAVFLQGDAMALPFEDDRFDVAVMALVIPQIGPTQSS